VEVQHASRPNAADVSVLQRPVSQGSRQYCEGAAVGGVCGLYNIDGDLADRLVSGFDGFDLRDRVVSHSHGLRKIEINQINALLAGPPADELAVS